MLRLFSPAQPPLPLPILEGRGQQPIALQPSGAGRPEKGPIHSPLRVIPQFTAALSYVVAETLNVVILKWVSLVRRGMWPRMTRAAAKKTRVCGLRGGGGLPAKSSSGTTPHLESQQRDSGRAFLNLPEARSWGRHLPWYLQHWGSSSGPGFRLSPGEFSLSGPALQPTNLHTHARVHTLSFIKIHN